MDIQKHLEKYNEAYQKEIAYNVLVIGVGGTGTAFLRDALRFTSALSDEKRKRIQFTLVDGDKIEDKNLARQGFEKEDVGKKKAKVYREIANDTYYYAGLNIQVHDAYLIDQASLKEAEAKGRCALEKKLGNETFSVATMMISCVDNVACRTLFWERFTNARKEHIYLLDSGNGFHTGNSFFSVKRLGVVLSPLPEAMGMAYEKDDEGEDRASASCGVINLSQPQHIKANTLAGWLLFHAFCGVIEEGADPTGFALFNTKDGTILRKKATEIGFVPYFETEVIS